MVHEGEMEKVMRPESEINQLINAINNLGVGRGSKKNSFNDTVKFISEVLYRAKMEHVKIAKSVLIPTGRQPHGVVRDAQYTYYASFHEVETTGRYGRERNTVLPREWRKRNGERGKGIFTLVGNVRGCADNVAAFLEVAKILQIDWEIERRPQLSAYENSKIIIEAHAYEPLRESELGSFLGKPNAQYCFKTEHGRESFWLVKWKTEHGTASLFYTLQYEEDPRYTWWEPVAPPFEEIIYNKDYICNYPDKELHIHDNISRADLSNTNVSVGTWSGDIAHYSFVDWSILKGRFGNVQYVFDPDVSESFLIGNGLLRKIKKIGLDLGFKPIDKKDKLGSCDDSSRRQLLIDEISNARCTVEEFFALAKEKHDIELQPAVVKKIDLADALMSLSQLSREVQDSGERTRYLIEELLWANSLTLLTGSAGVGKSLFSLDIAVAIASGQQFLNHFIVPDPKRVLYIDAENNPEYIHERVQGFKARSDYDSELLDKNLRIYSLIHKGRQIDLTVARDRDELKKQSRKFDLIIFDNLGKLASPKIEKSIESWRVVSDFFINLTIENKAVLVIHHENKQGDIRGSGKIVDDCEFWISLKKPENIVDARAFFEFRFKKTRSLVEDPSRLFSLEYITSDGVTSRQIRFSDELVSDEIEATEAHKSDQDNRDNDFKELERDILEVSQKFEGPFKRKMLIKELMNKNNGYLYTNDEKFEKAVSYRLRKLVDSGVLKINGQAGPRATYTVILNSSVEG